MDTEHMREVVNLYSKELKDRGVEPARGAPSPLAHAAWMLDEILAFLEDGRWDKANRWLGFVQGTLWVLGVYTIPQMADHNRKPSGEEGGAE